MSFSSEPGDPHGTAASQATPADGTGGPDPTRQDVRQRPPTDDRAAKETAKNMLPSRRRRALGFERFVMRVVATCGIVGIGVALGAILVSSNVQGWITGLVVSLVSVILAAMLWSSRQL